MSKIRGSMQGRISMALVPPAPKPADLDAPMPARRPGRQRKSLKQYIYDKSLMGALEREVRRMLKNRELKAADKIKVIEHGYKLVAARHKIEESSKDDSFFS
jgi:hypothetical protein